MPPNLAKLSRPLQELAKFLWLDADLIKVAVRSSAKATVLQPGAKDRTAWIAALDIQEKDELLLFALQGDLPQLGSELHQRFQRYWASRNPIPHTSAATRRYAKELFAAFELQSEETKAQEERKAAEEAQETRSSGGSRRFPRIPFQVAAIAFGKT